jgi:zinc and cadmium transporter
MYELLAFIMIFAISCVSLIGLAFISLKEKTLDKLLFVLVAFATGSIIATSFFDLIPEAFGQLEELNGNGAQIDIMVLFIFITLGFIVFYILERFIYWFHGHAHEEENQFVCHDNSIESVGVTAQAKNSTTKIQNYVILNLVGDGFHNFLDGVIIMVGFLHSLQTGFIITMAVLAHEIPQEVGDFGVLLYGGLTKKKALIWNFISGLTSMIGGVFALVLSNLIASFSLFFLAFSGGGFLYIGCVELMPEALKERNLKKSVVQTLIFLGGILLIYIMITSLPHV